MTNKQFLALAIGAFIGGLNVVLCSILPAVIGVSRTCSIIVFSSLVMVGITFILFNYLNRRSKYDAPHE
jgi:hypothetical protein